MPRTNTASDSYEALMWDIICDAHRYSPKNGDRVLDLGAHFGMFSLFCAARGCLVTAYEPSAAAYKELFHSAEVAEEIGTGVIDPRPFAVWSSSGQCKLGRRGDNTSAAKSLVLSEWGYEDVLCVTLDEAMAKYPKWQCVKVDIEGAEFEVLRMASRELLERIEFLTLEIHNDILSRQQCQFVGLTLRNHFPRVEALPVKVQGKPTEQVAAYYCWR